MVDPIELLRQRLEGHSQREIARAAGVSDSHLSDILSCRRSPKGVLKFLGLRNESHITTQMDLYLNEELIGRVSPEGIVVELEMDFLCWPALAILACAARCPAP